MPSQAHSESRESALCTSQSAFLSLAADDGDITSDIRSKAPQNIVRKAAVNAVLDVAGASAFPLIAADAAEGSKHEMFGDVRPHKVLPFAVEDGGALGREAKTFFHTCKAACANQLRGADYERQTGTARDYSNFFFQSISAANYRGLSRTLIIAGGTIRASLL